MQITYPPEQTVCGIDELAVHSQSNVTHVLSIIDPERAELDVFSTYGFHSRKTLRFHDIIEPAPGLLMPNAEHVASILEFGRDLVLSGPMESRARLLVHCHMGVSRSTAAMLMVMAQAAPEETADRLFQRLRTIRPRAWPNSVLIRYADKQLDCDGRLIAGLCRHYAYQVDHQPGLSTWMSEIGRRREVEMAA